MNTEKYVYSLLCWNIRGFQSARASKIAEFIRCQSADIVCLQEDVNLVELAECKWLKDCYFVAETCDGESVSRDFVWNATQNVIPVDRADDVRLCNTILVKKSLSYLVTASKQFQFDPRGIAERCVCAIRFAGLLIANTHLCGGRHDDQHYATLVDAKAEEMSQLVEALKPDIVVGDFNAESNWFEALSTLNSYPLFEDLGTAEKELFLQYYRSAHLFLQENGYVPAFAEQDVRPTSAFGGVPDWIYVKSGLQDTVFDVKKVEAIPYYSDHNALYCWFRVK